MMSEMLQSLIVVYLYEWCKNLTMSLLIEHLSFLEHGKQLLLKDIHLNLLFCLNFVIKIM